VGEVGTVPQIVNDGRREWFRIALATNLRIQSCPDTISDAIDHAGCDLADGARGGAS
jgi:hypothetical protein